MARSVPKSQNPHGLTDQQLRFCQHYAVSLNATAAYKAAGYSWKTDTVARANASILIAKHSIQAYLGEVMNLTNVSVVHETAAIAFANITDAMEWDEDGVSVIPSERLTHRGKSAIKSVKCKKKTITRHAGEVQEVEVSTEWEVTLHDKLAALEKLMRKLSLYPKVEQVTESDVLDKLMEMEILPTWIADCASKNISRARQENAALLKGILSEPLIYQLSKEREATGGLSEDTYNRIRAEIMGIDAKGTAALPAEVFSEQIASADNQEI
jgi:phage terminase small subunit